MHCHKQMLQYSASSARTEARGTQGNIGTEITNSSVDEAAKLKNEHNQQQHIETIIR